MTQWDDIIYHNIIKKPGEHCLIVGTTGTGKTQLLYYLLDAFTTLAPEETVSWFDTGKSAEVLRISEFGPITIHSEHELKVDIHPIDPTLIDRFKFKNHHTTYELWNNIDKGKINVFCIEPFYPDPKEYSIAARDVFRSLIESSRDYTLKRNGVIPLTIFIDELQWLVPTDRTALCREHNEGAKWFQRNIETMRSLGIRIIASTQNWMKIRPGVRESFSWLFLKRGAKFFYDRQHLQRFNKVWMGLKNNEFYLVSPDSKFSEEILKTPFYGKGEDLGEVEYHDLRRGKVSKEPIPGFA